MNPDLDPAPIRKQPALMTVTRPGSDRRVAIAVDLSDESGHAVTWAVQNYLRPGDSVVLLHVRPTSVLYGADWGSIKLQINNTHTNQLQNDQTAPSDVSQQQLEEEYDNFATRKAEWLGGHLEEAGIPYKVHIVKDHDLKQRLCLEVQRLGLSAVIMGSRGFGSIRRRGGKQNSRNSSWRRKLGSVSDYCVHHSICPVVIVRSPEEKELDATEEVEKEKEEEIVVNGEINKAKELYPVREEEVSEEEEEEEEEGME